MKTRLHKFLSIFLVSVMLLTAAPLSGFVGLDLNLDWLNLTTKASAATYSGTCGDNLTWTFDELTGELSITGSGDMLEMADATAVPWYGYRNEVLKITIQEGITSISRIAFEGCVFLSEVSIPESVTKIGEKAFNDCRSIKTITLPPNLTEINYKTFYYCIELESIIIPDKVKSIGGYAFYQCYSLKEVAIPGSVTSIAWYAFDDCINLERIYYNWTEEKWDELGYKNWYEKEPEIIFATNHEHTFYLEKVAEPTCTENGVKLFSCYCGENYTEEIPVVDHSLKTHYSAATCLKQGYECDKCTVCAGEFNLRNYEDIGDHAWRNEYVAPTCLNDGYYCLSCSVCDAQKDVVILPKLQHTSFEWVYLIEPTCEESGVRIQRCTACLTEVDRKDVPSLEHTAGLWIVDTEPTCQHVGFEVQKCIYCSEILNSRTTAKADHTAGTWGIENFATCTQEGTQVRKCTVCSTVLDRKAVEKVGHIIGDWTIIRQPSNAQNDILAKLCKNCRSEMDRIEIHKLNETNYGFCGDTVVWSLDTVTGELVISGTGAMKNYSYMNDIYPPWASYYSSIKTIMISDDVTTVGEDAFSGCNNLASVTIGNSVTTIGEYAFEYCRSLASITFGNSVTKIDYCAFRGCSGLTSITIPDSVTSIGTDAFENCDSLATVTIGTGASFISYYAFFPCESLVSFTVAEGNTSYSSDEYGVLFNKNKTELVKYPTGNKRISYSIPNSVTKIEAFAFNRSKSLESVTIPDSITEIGNYAFSGCSSLKRVVFEGTQERWQSFEYDDWDGTVPEIIFLNNHEHSYTATIKQQPTCTATGMKEFSCICGQNYSEILPMTEHTLEVYRLAPTCVKQGYECDKCSACGEEFNHRNYEDIVDHIWENEYVAPTCSQEGYQCLKCSICSEQKDVVAIPKLSHTPLEWVLLSEPTCEEPGVKIQRCKVCLTEVDRVETPALGHTPGEWKVESEATCSQKGLKVKNCNTCKEVVESEEIPAPDHISSDWEADTAPTCQHVGFEVQKCTVCSKILKSRTIPKLSHTYSEWTVITEPTTTQTGEKTHRCTACSSVERLVISPTGFEPVNGLQIDFANDLIYGLDVGCVSLDDYSNLLVSSYSWSYTISDGRLGTGSKAVLTRGSTYSEYTIVIFGDVNGDGWYDGTDSIIVSCLANGLLTQDSVSEAVYRAADCNHDGVIDSFDVAILEQAGLLLSNVDQSKSNEELATDEAFIEYLDLIDQTPEDEDIVEDEVIETPEVETETEEFDLIEFIITIIKKFFELLLSSLPIK